jgi:hypothetical protein
MLSHAKIPGSRWNLSRLVGRESHVVVRELNEIYPHDFTTDMQSRTIARANNRVAKGPEKTADAVTCRYLPHTTKKQFVHETCINLS